MPALRKFVMVMICAAAVGSACSSGSSETTVGGVAGGSTAGAVPATEDPSTTAATGTTQPPQSATVSSLPSSTTSQSVAPAAEDDPFATIAGLREELGATRLVARSGDVVVAVSDDGEIELSDNFPTPYSDQIVVDGSILNYDGQQVCLDFELLGDFNVIDGIEAVDGSLLVTVEDRRALGSEVGSDPVDLPRWRYDCAAQETEEVLSITTVESQNEAVVVRTATSTGLQLVEERGLGDTPLRLTTAAGTVVIDVEDTAFDYVLSADGETVYFTTYAGSGAAEPPDGVVAVDTETGDERWRLPIGGYVSIFGDQLVVEAVDTSALTDLGLFPGREVLVVDPATGVELDRFPFGGRLIGLF